MGLINSNIPELEGTDTEIVLSNLDALESELEHLLERRIAHITELANSIIADGGDEDIITSIILSIRYDSDSDFSGISSSNIKELKTLYAGLSIAERLMIFRQVFSKLYSSKKGLSKFLLDGNFEVSENAYGKIVYLKNSFNDSAYLAFSDFLASPTAHYADSVTEVCSCVLDGRCEYCILPIETSNDGKLLSFLRAIIKFGLKINLVFDLKSKDSDNLTRYALLSLKSISAVPTSRIRNKERFFDFIIPDTDNMSVSEVIMSAQLCSLEPERIDTITLNSDSQRFFCMSFKTNHADIGTFVSYLAIDCPDFIPLGLYARI